MTGQAATPDSLSDALTGVSRNAFSIERNVEMYQWREHSESKTKENAGGSTETTTTYTYDKGWSSSAQDSTSFHEQTGHVNPAMQYRSDSVDAQNGSLGAFALTPELIRGIRNSQTLAFTEADLAGLSADLRRKAVVSSGVLFVGQEARPSPGAPVVGDYRISLKITATPQAVSLVSRQIGNTFEPYVAKSGYSLSMIRIGTLSAETMFAQAQKSNRILTWFLRFLGFFLMMGGLNLMFKPLSVLASVLPILGRIVQAGTGFVAFLVSAPLSFVTIAIAWFVYRPVLSVILLVIAAGIVVGALRWRKSHPSKQISAPATVKS
jgi:hypothetical protein